MLQDVGVQVFCALASLQAHFGTEVNSYAFYVFTGAEPVAELLRAGRHLWRPAAEAGPFAIQAAAG